MVAVPIILTKTNGSGHLYQGRYKSFLVDTGSYLLTLIKYIERNAVRAKLVKRCEDWRWGSAWLRVHGTSKQKKLLDSSPEPFPHKYLSWINIGDKEEDLRMIRTSIDKGVPYGKGTWIEKMVLKYHLESTLKSPGRPRKSR